MPVVRALVAGALALAVALPVTVGAAPASAEPRVPTPREIAAQRRLADDLTHEAGRTATAVQRAQAEVHQLAQAASDALEVAEQARQRTVVARREARQARERAAQAAQRAEEARLALSRYASAAYRTGFSDPFATLGATLEARGPSDFTYRLEVLGMVGEHGVTVSQRMTMARAESDEQSALADQKLAEARSAQAEALAAQRLAADLVAEQRAAVVRLQAQLTATRDAAAVAAADAVRMERARKVALQRAAEQERARLAAIRAGRVVLGRGSCTGGEVSGYGNGQIPESRLCPLWGYPYHLLRADAAAAFNALSRAYAGTWGNPICVTDSYRSLAMQVELKRRKPELAATPGTSNHGWGTAVDLCDGLNVFDTPPYRWMKDNAPRYGWYHPSWAEPGGSKPEPWHWEFSG